MRPRQGSKDRGPHGELDVLEGGLACNRNIYFEPLLIEAISIRFGADRCLWLGPAGAS